MVLRICVPAIHSPSARKRNCASERWSATAAMVAKSLGVSTPFIGMGSFFEVAGLSTVVVLILRLPRADRRRPHGARCVIGVIRCGPCMVHGAMDHVRDARQPDSG